MRRMESPAPGSLTSASCRTYLIGWGSDLPTRRHAQESRPFSQEDALCPPKYNPHDPSPISHASFALPGLAAAADVTPVPALIEEARMNTRNDLRQILLARSAALIAAATCY